jgi:hypothetical protein
LLMSVRLKKVLFSFFQLKLQSENAIATVHSIFVRIN